MSSGVSRLPSLREILGFVGAALLPGLFLSLPFLAAGWWSSALAMFGLGLRMAVPVSILVALPIFLWLRSIGRLRLHWAVLAGGASGAAFALFGIIGWIWRFGGGKSVPEIWQGALAYTEPHLFIVIGMICGLCGWLIAFGPRIAPIAEGRRDPEHHGL